MHTDPRITAIRTDPRVGNGSCTSIDECWEDSELLAALDEDSAVTPEQAIAWALDLEGLHLEQGLNQREGTDNDPQLLAWREWQSAGD